MDDEEATAASGALIDWFHDQGISPFDAILVMAVTIGYIHTSVQELTEDAE